MVCWCVVCCCLLVMMVMFLSGWWISVVVIVVCWSGCWLRCWMMFIFGISLVRIVLFMMSMRLLKMCLFVFVGSLWWWFCFGGWILFFVVCLC